MPRGSGITAPPPGGTAPSVAVSESTNGRPIKVVATSSPGTLIHTALAGTESQENIWVWAVNTDSTARTLTVQWGGTTAPDDAVPITIQPNEGIVLVVPGAPLNNGVLVKAYASSANVINIIGWVN